VRGGGGEGGHRKYMGRKQLVAVYKIQLHVLALYVGQLLWTDDGLHTGPKHVVVSYVLLLIAILLCS